MTYCYRSIFRFALRCLIIFTLLLTTQNVVAQKTGEDEFIKGNEALQKGEQLKGIDLLLKSASLGYAKAYYQLGRLHLPEDLEGAAFNIRKAAELGHVPAQAWMAWLHGKNNGYTSHDKFRDPDLEKYWLEKAAKNGDQDSIKTLAYMKRQEDLRKYSQEVTGIEKTRYESMKGFYYTVMELSFGPASEAEKNKVMPIVEKQVSICMIKDPVKNNFEDAFKCIRTPIMRALTGARKGKRETQAEKANKMKLLEISFSKFAEAYGVSGTFMEIARKYR